MKSIRKAFRNSTDSGHSSEGYSVPNSPNSASELLSHKLIGI